ncbi:MAG: META domain-containing protein [Moraxella sp.]|nr:META domain-containing protein [Moraxella sp.]
MGLVKNGERYAPIKGDNGEALTIQFTQKDKRVTVLNGCNLMSGAYQIEQGELKIGALMSTRKMCEPALMQVDSLVGKLLQTQNNFKLERFVDALPDAVEWVIEVDGEQYRFVKIKS